MIKPKSQRRLGDSSSELSPSLMSASKAVITSTDRLCGVGTALTLEQKLILAYKEIEWYKKKLSTTKRLLRETLIKLSKAQVESTTATPVSVAREHGRKVCPNDSKIHAKKVSTYKFNNSSDEKSSSKYSICEEEHLGNCMNK